MKIQWLGHACFYLTSSEGVHILTDPFVPKVGYPVPSVEADIVTESHQHSDHNYINELKGKFTVINRPGSYTEHGIAILGVPTFHDKEHGKMRGPNIVYRFTIDELTVVHCGDLGHLLTVEQVQEIGKVDVLLLPVGGHYTIDSHEAVQVMTQLRPSLTVPMHFKTAATSMPIAGVETFLAAAGGGKRAGAQAIQISAEDLQKPSKVVVLDFPK